MKRIVFIVKQPGFLRYVGTQVERLCEAGCSVHIGVQDAPINDEDGQLAAFAARYPQFSVGVAPHRRDVWKKIADSLRGALDWGHYMTPELWRAEKLRTRSAPNAGPFGELVWKVARRAGLASNRVTAGLVQSTLRSIHSSLPPSPQILAYLRQLDPDVVLLTGLVWPRSAQADYVLACRKLGVPTGYIVNSWDNLTNKGDVKAVPDEIHIWNVQQQAEASRLHGAPRRSVKVVGAPLFDRWFGRAPSETRATFAARVGLPDDSPFVLYTCSSPAIAPGDAEPAFFRRWLAALRSCGDLRLAQMNILVRPHPFNAGAWKGVSIEDPKVAIHPRHGRWIVRDADRDDYFNALSHSAVVVGINTSAMLEAAIVGARTFTIQTGDFAAMQDETVHFHYLVDLGIVQSHASLPEHVAALAKAVADQGAAGAQRPPIPGVVPFVRPKGVDAASTPVAADAILALAARRPWRLDIPLWRPALWLALGVMTAVELAPSRKATSLPKPKANDMTTPKPSAKPKSKRNEVAVRQTQSGLVGRLRDKFARTALQRLMGLCLRVIPSERIMLRHIVGTQFAKRAFERFVDAEANLVNIATSEKTILVGPWISEVGFEALYWIPFIHWMRGEYKLSRKQLLMVSRGGVASWYGSACGAYVDVFDLLSPKDFMEGNKQRIRDMGHQKQSRPHAFERKLCDMAAEKAGVGPYVMLHPSVMNGLYMRFWEDICGTEFIERFSRFQPFGGIPPLKDGDLGGVSLPERYVAARFYFRESFPDTPSNRQAIVSVLRRMAQHTDVVLLSSDIKVDDHSDFSFADSPRIHVVDAMRDPARNLAIQTRILADADAFVGTYGGLTYIANYLGKTSLCFESDPQFNRPMHTEFAQRKLRAFGGRLHLLHPDDERHFERLFAALPNAGVQNGAALATPTDEPRAQSVGP